jgi:hypothetical protein
MPAVSGQGGEYVQNIQAIRTVKASRQRKTVMVRIQRNIFECEKGKKQTNVIPLSLGFELSLEAAENSDFGKLRKTGEKRQHRQ